MRLIKKILAVTGAAVLIAFSVFILVLLCHYTPPIAMYHSVKPDAEASDRLSITDKTFEKQMSFLSRHHYNVVSLEKLADYIKGGKSIPPKTVVLTFDDGNLNNYVYAYPILKKYNLPATMFVIIEEVGRPQGDKVTWEQIKEMNDSGLITIGSHALGPEPLVNIGSEEEIRRQVFDSKKILEEKLGKPVFAFSYPEGLYNGRIKQTVIDAGYKAAVGTKTGRGSSSKDLFALKRLRISSNADNLFIFAFETSGYYNFLKENRHKK